MAQQVARVAGECLWVRFARNQRSRRDVAEVDGTDAVYPGSAGVGLHQAAVADDLSERVAAVLADADR
jgi:hypothetical protein